MAGSAGSDTRTGIVELEPIVHRGDGDIGADSGLAVVSPFLLNAKLTWPVEIASPSMSNTLGKLELCSTIVRTYRLLWFPVYLG